MEFNPKTVHLMTEEEINRHSRSRWEKLYQQVDGLLKRFTPLSWSQVVAWQFRMCKGDMKLLATRPPHFLLRSVEANAAYWRKQHHDPVTDKRFAQVMNAYIDHNDPLLLYFAAKDIVSMVLLLAREQFEIQVHPSNQEIARLWLMFIKRNPMPLSTAAFFDHFNITPTQWMQLCYATYSVASNDKDSRVSVQTVLEYAQGYLGVNAIDWFVKKSSWTPEQFGKNYTDVRKKTPTQFHSFIRSGFLQVPFIEFGDGRWLAPSVELIFRHMGNGLYRLFRELWESGITNASEMRQEFGVTCENHVARLLDSYKSKLVVLNESTLKPLASGKSCDFLLEASDSILLVESKSVTFERDLLFPKQMQEDVTTTRIIEGTEQLRETYEELIQGRFDSLISDHSKPVISVIATYGEVPYANTDWYFDRVIFPRAKERGKSVAPPTCGLPSRPIVLSHESIEMFIIALNTFGVTPAMLVAKREAEHFLASGEWNAYLRQRLQNVAIEVLPYVEAAAEEFYESLGAGEESQRLPTSIR
jgi:hypothetical protein